MQSKIDQFKGLFGFGAKPAVEQPTPASSLTPPVAESAPNLIDAVLANLGTKPSGENVPANNDQPLPEVTAPPQPGQTQPEQTPAEKLKQQIADSIDAFLEEVAKEKTAP